MLTRAEQMLERWAADLAAAIDRAVEDPEAPAILNGSSYALLRPEPAGSGGRVEYRRAGLAFDLVVVAEATVGYVGAKSPVVVGAAGDRGSAALEIALVRGEERLAGTFRYGLHPFSGRLRLDRPAFRAALRALVRSAGYLLAEE